MDFGLDSSDDEKLKEWRIRSKQLSEYCMGRNRSKQLSEYCMGRNRNSFATRDDRSWQAIHFLDSYAKNKKDYPVIEVCTWLGGERLRNDKWLGITWVALHGIDSLCVVALSDDLFELGRQIFFDGTFLYLCWNAIVSKVEGIEECMFGGSRKRPFSVVTVFSGGTSNVCKRIGHEASGAEYLAKKTSAFLQEEMENGATFTFEKTMQTAISAFQHLFCREFKAHEIQAFAWKDDAINGKELQQYREKPDLEEILASINKSDNSPDTFTPKKDGTLLEGGLQRCSREGQGDSSSWLSGTSKASEKATHPEEVRESRVQRRPRRIKVRKSSSNKATKEKGDAKDTVDHGGTEKDVQDNDAIMQEANIEEEQELRRWGFEGCSSG